MGQASRTPHLPETGVTYIPAHDAVDEWTRAASDPVEDGDDDVHVSAEYVIPISVTYGRVRDEPDQDRQKD